jgi:tight adherence protein C
MPFTALILTFLLGVILIGLSLSLSLQINRNNTLSENSDISPPEPLLRDTNKASPSFIGRLLEPKSASEMSESRKNLMQAGWTAPTALLQFTIVKILAALFGAIIGIILISIVDGLQNAMLILRVNLVLGLFLFFYLLPGVVVRVLRKRFRERIARALPDALDLMLVCVESGQSIDKAIVRVSQDMSTLHPELAARFEAVSEALKAGADRADTFNKLAYETDNEDLRSFAAVVMQSISSGAPISETFRVYSADLRDQRIRRIEEKASKLPTKMTLGTMAFTVPPLIILLLAPAVARILAII